MAILRKPASAYIWGLVCGFPGQKRTRRGLLMLDIKAYVDGSGEGDASVFVLAGYLSTAEKWAEFSEKWQG